MKSAKNIVNAGLSTTAGVAGSALYGVASVIASKVIEQPTFTGVIVGSAIVCGSFLLANELGNGFTKAIEIVSSKGKDTWEEFTKSPIGQKLAKINSELSMAPIVIGLSAIGVAGISDTSGSYMPLATTIGLSALIPSKLVAKITQARENIDNIDVSHKHKA